MCFGVKVPRRGLALHKKCVRVCVGKEQHGKLGRAKRVTKEVRLEWFTQRYRFSPIPMIAALKR